MENKKFACAINCMDGRVQEAVRNYLIENYQVDFVDMITEPGPIKILAERKEAGVIDNIKKRVAISVEKHKALVLAIVGHEDCAGNPVDKNTQIEQLKLAKKVVEEFGFNIEIILLYVEGDWKRVEKI